MSRILLDQNVPYEVRALFPGRDVKTVYEMGWSTLGNGSLLKAAEAAGLAVMVTCDQSIRYQQNMAARRIGLAVLSTNNWNVLRDQTDVIRQSVVGLVPNGYVFVQCGPASNRRREGRNLKP